MTKIFHLSSLWQNFGWLGEVSWLEIFLSALTEESIFWWESNPLVGPWVCLFSKKNKIINCEIWIVASSVANLFGNWGSEYELLQTKSDFCKSSIILQKESEYELVWYSNGRKVVGYQKVWYLNAIWMLFEYQVNTGYLGHHLVFLYTVRYSSGWSSI